MMYGALVRIITQSERTKQFQATTRSAGRNQDHFSKKVRVRIKPHRQYKITPKGVYFIGGVF
jgi:hypothetical protein